MRIIYIDANIYLGFYNSNRPEFKKLLDSIVELKDKIILTQQIAFEIDRNKLNVFRQSINNYVKQVSHSATKLPEHLDEKNSPKFAEWNKERKEIDIQVTKSNKDLEPILNEVLNDIAISKDNVSLSISELYKNALIPTSEEINQARIRREIGNPPGKRADPLGDQLSWEQLLGKLNDVTEVWIISNDKDYFTEHNKTIYLNPVLYNDIVAVNSDISIKTFNVLAEALREYNKQEEIKSIPSNEELNLIAEKETTDLLGITGSTVSYIQNASYPPSKPTICPKCNAEKSFLDGSYLRSQYGGLTLQYICKNCGFHADTGDSFD